MKMVDKFTSTGIKFWKHQEQMFNYASGNPKTIISTHISPQGFCNLNCSYCSVKKRQTNWTIDLDVIKQYVLDLKTRGLKAVILTGGGEPTTYPKFNELISWLVEQNLKIALITNGTQTHLVSDWSHFSWIRVSLNQIPNWKDRISLPIDKISSNTIIGASYVDTGKLETSINDLKFMVEKLNAKYLRILPNCLLPNDKLKEEHIRIDNIFEKYDVSDKFFHQYKVHETPTSICHQSYFRPYLSEVDGGTVYPCDSVVLNDTAEHFAEKYKLCSAKDVLKYIDKNIMPKFDPITDCKGCVFCGNNKLIDEYLKTRNQKFEEFRNIEVIHEEFV